MALSSTPGVASFSWSARRSYPYPCFRSYPYFRSCSHFFIPAALIIFYTRRFHPDASCAPCGGFGSSLPRCTRFLASEFCVFAFLPFRVSPLPFRVFVSTASDYSVSSSFCVPSSPFFGRHVPYPLPTASINFHFHSINFFFISGPPAFHLVFIFISFSFFILFFMWRVSLPHIAEGRWGAA
ncbi:hypothetical protein C8J57DRAFT_413221 [Mycena rebaudengoi]|nr:hypothetical protein C8J57DRAFT_413221 [Mycena rebaudengoi]